MTSTTFKTSFTTTFETTLESTSKAIVNLHVSNTAQKKSAYLVNPFFDLTFICGGLVLALCAICTYRFGSDTYLTQQSTPIIALGIFGTYLLSGPHTGATLFRLYGEAENRRRFLFVSYILPAILIVAFIAGFFVPAIAKIEAILYLVLVWHHYMAQSYGIAMMYCARAGMQLSAREKLLPRAILYLAVTVAVCQQFTADWQRQSFLNIPLEPMAFLPAPLITILQSFLLVAIAAFLIEQVARLRKGQKVMPLPAVVTLLTCGLFLVIGRSLSDLVWLFVPNFFHATQYLAVVLAYQLKQGSEKKPTTSLLKNVERLADRFGEFFLIGLALFTALPFVISALGIPLYLCSALVFFSLSFHHFAADACIWKLRDKSVRSRLVS